MPSREVRVLGYLSPDQQVIPIRGAKGGFLKPKRASVQFAPVQVVKPKYGGGRNNPQTTLTTLRTGLAPGSPLCGRWKKNRLMKRFNGQYHAGDPVGPRMQDIATDVKRSMTRTGVGNWELREGFKAALSVDDELDRRKAMRAAAKAADMSAGTALDGDPVADPGPDQVSERGPDACPDQVAEHRAESEPQPAGSLDSDQRLSPGRAHGLGDELTSEPEQAAA